MQRGTAGRVLRRVAVGPGTQAWLSDEAAERHRRELVAEEAAARRDAEERADAAEERDIRWRVEGGQERTLADALELASSGPTGPTGTRSWYVGRRPGQPAGQLAAFGTYDDQAAKAAHRRERIAEVLAQKPSDGKWRSRAGRRG